MRFIAVATIAASIALTGPALATQLAQPGWNEQRFALFNRVNFTFQGPSLGIASDGAASIAYRALPQADWGARSASWGWSVSETVPPTDLTQRGGDDRNAAIYFVFLPEAEAALIGPNGSVRRLLSNDNARVLVYVWGGAHARGDVLASPYLGPRGRTIVSRPSGTGAFSESVDLAGDFARAFGEAPGMLVGLAISADSDDTETVIRAQIDNLTLN